MTKEYDGLHDSYDGFDDLCNELHDGCDRYDGLRHSHSGYRDEYCRDEEMYVYDQHCGNCAFYGSETCPMFLDEEEARPAVIEAKEEQRKEDAVVRDSELEWCIYWRQDRHRR